MKILCSHWRALGTAPRYRLAAAVVIYGGAALVAYVLWSLWARGLSSDTLTMIATVQSVVATVLLTVMGSIYSGLPSAIRRTRHAQRAIRAQPRDLGASDSLDGYSALIDRRGRAEFEGVRLDVLTGLFSHTAMSVAIALISLPFIIGSMQCSTSKDADVLACCSWLNLIILFLTAATVSVVFLVLLNIHTLVTVDVADEEPPSE